MKKTLFILALLISSPLIYAQELTVTPDGLRDKSNVEKTYVIIAAPNKTAEQSYNNIITYINKTYKNPQEVIKGDVKSEYLRFNTHVSSFLVIKNSGVKVDIDANYTIELAFKNDRVKFEVTDLDMHNSSNYNVLFSGGAFAGFPIYNKKKTKLVRPDTKNEIEIYFNNTINIIKSYLLEEVKSDDDDW